MYSKTLEEILLIKKSAEILSKVHGEIAAHIQPGVTTQQLDKIAATCIADHKAKSSFKGYKRYPNTLCTSVNNQIVHGIPSKYTLKEGDTLSIDCGVCYKGYHSDAAFTYGVGNIEKKLLNLLIVTQKALYKGIEQAIVKNTIGHIGHAIYSYVTQHGYKVITAYGGHGIGKKLHEEPHIPNFGKKGQGIHIKEGMVLAIEPIVSYQSPQIVHKLGTWPVYTKDHSPTAHFEHTIAITDGKPEILTTYEYIKEALQKYE